MELTLAVPDFQAQKNAMKACHTKNIFSVKLSRLKLDAFTCFLTIRYAVITDIFATTLGGLQKIPTTKKVIPIMRRQILHNFFLQITPS